MAEQQDRARRAAPVSMARALPAAWGIALVEVAIGYEWLLSGLNKVLSADFSSGLAHELQTSLQGNPNAWYGSLTSTLVLPHTHLFAALVEVGELLVAAGMFAGAALWVSGRLASSRVARLLNLGAIAALVGGVLMSVNYALLGGDTLPGINAANPFNEGLSIDSLLAMIGVCLLLIHVFTWRRASSAVAPVPLSEKRAYHRTDSTVA
jgi:thiosulfate dehydrogenase [quinone] large subunit